MKLRYGLPKYRGTWSGLYALGLGLVWLAHQFNPPAAVWITMLGFLTIAAGMSVFVAGMIAERRDWERQHPKEVENHSHLA